VTHLLDTNAWIEVLNRPQGKVASRLAAHKPVDVALCSVALGELLVGAYKSAKPQRNLTLVLQLVHQFRSLTFDDLAADQYARIRATLESQGTPIGPYDMQIAGIALVHDLTVVTHNTADFQRIPNLRLEDWQV
jgi:tRNA(fMet)-specific endonuclease VapC